MDWLIAAGLGFGVYLVLKPRSQPPAPSSTAPALPPAQPPPYGPQYTPDPVAPVAPAAPGLAPTGAQLAGVAQFLRDSLGASLLAVINVAYDASTDEVTIDYPNQPDASRRYPWPGIYTKLFDPNTCEERDPPFFGPCKYSQAGGS